MRSPIEFIRVWPGCEVAVHEDDDHLTGWVLREQRRWFESEITMLPRLLAPGGRFVDVGANVGVYSLAAAQLVGPGGRVVSFEPSPEARTLLEAGARRNGFDWMVVRPEALADQPGQADLWFDDETELASLSRPSSETSRSVPVAVTTLDLVHQALGLAPTDLLKIDAEGAEEAIFRGGRVFLAEGDPILLHEIKRGDKVDLSVAAHLAEAGFLPYRHVPGLDILAPFSLDGFVDPYQLNLFAMSPARAATLVDRGILASGIGAAPTVPVERGAERLARLPWARALSTRWRGAASADSRLWSALALHAFAHEDTAAGAAERWSALEKALSLSLARLNEQPTVPRLLTVARIASETGARALAVRTLRDAIATLRSGEQGALDEPFLLPGPSLETARPLGPIEGLVLSAALTAHERLRTFSAFFTGLQGLADLRLVGLLGYPDEEMSRRLAMLERRATKSLPG